MLRNCAETRYVQHTAYALTHRKWRSKPSRSLMSEGFREPLRTCPLCSKRERESQLRSDSLSVNQKRTACCDKFRKAEGRPYSCSSCKPAEQKGCRYDNDHIAQQRDVQCGLCFSKAFQGPGAGNGNSRYNKAQTDDMQSSYADFDGLGAGGKQSD